MDSPETAELLGRAATGEAWALDLLLGQHRDYLKRVLGLRLDPKLRARFDESDVVQEACLEAARRLPEYHLRRPMPFRLWLRATALDALLRLRRQHAGADCRDVEREVTISDPSALMLVDRVAADAPSPGSQARRHERAGLAREAVEALAEEDRRIILLRNFEELTNAEAAAVLGLEPNTASKRYARALLRLRDQFARLGITDSPP